MTYIDFLILAFSYLIAGVIVEYFRERREKKAAKERELEIAESFKALNERLHR